MSNFQNIYKDLSYDEAISKLFTLVSSFQTVGYSAFHSGLAAMKQFDDVLSHPHSKYKIIHIAGTNGKGSVAHFITSALMSKGYKVGLYTSPHLVDFRERIKINGEMIPKEAVMSFLNKYGSFIHSENLSFFEITTGMAFEWFAISNVDYAVIETGLGGRLDSTNIVSPELSIITSIGIDHKELLGDTKELIAVEKGGIIKKGVPVVLGMVDQSVQNVLKQIADERDAELILSDQSPDMYDDLPGIELKGDYQRINLKTVYAALKVLKIDFQDVKEALCFAASRTGLRGRWEKLSDLPLVICDIAHNEQAISISMKQYNSLFESGKANGKQFGRKIIIFGVMADKDLESMTKYLPKDAFYYFTNVSSSRAMPADILSNKLSAKGFEGKNISGVSSALEMYYNESKKDDLVYIGGSSYVVAEAVEWYDKK